MDAKCFSFGFCQARFKGGILGLILLLTVGCFGSVAPIVNDRDPILNDDVIQTAQASNQFGESIYGQLAEKPGNLFFSPASISAAMSMVWRGAEQETAEQIQGALHVKLEESKHHTANGEMVRLLNLQGKGYELRLANRLWGQIDFEFRDDFLRALENDYRAPLGLVDFVSRLEESRLSINAWVEQQTNNRIKQLFSSGALDGDTRLVLVNAIYFKAGWGQPFDKQKTRDEPFRVTASERVSVPMMNRTDDMLYGETEDVQLVRLPYANPELSMTVILPKRFGEISEIQRQWLSPDSPIANLRLQKREVKLELPRFKIESEFQLNQVMQDLGILRAFTPLAEFGRMSTADDLMIGVVVHKAFVEVTEEGTEAAAATGVGMKTLMAPIGGPTLFRADQPFLFFIQHEPSQAILFAGRVVDPR